MSLTVSQTLSAWTRLWNGDLDVARQICAPDFTIFFGRADADGQNPADRLVGPDDLAGFIRDFRAERPGLTYSEVRLLDLGTHGVSLWDADRDDLHVGGIDVFEFDGAGLVRRVWSVTGQRHLIP